MNQKYIIRLGIPNFDISCKLADERALQIIAQKKEKEVKSFSIDFKRFFIEGIAKRRLFCYEFELNLVFDELVQGNC